MFIYEIEVPGMRIEDEDRDWAWKINGQLHSLISQFYEANVALNLFAKEMGVPPIIPDFDDLVHENRRQTEIYKEVEKELDARQSPKSWPDIHFEGQVRFKREKWAAGQVPLTFENKPRFIYARAFLYALDTFEKILGVLSKEDRVPAEVADFHLQVSASFPHLRQVRNTAHHLEDRARGLGGGRNPQPLDLKPINNNFIEAPEGGVLVLDCLNDSRYGSTMSDGHYGEVDVSPHSMEHLQRILQGVVLLFNWTGPRQHAPR